MPLDVVGEGLARLFDDILLPVEIEASRSLVGETEVVKDGLLDEESRLLEVDPELKPLVESVLPISELADALPKVLIPEDRKLEGVVAVPIESVLIEIDCCDESLVERLSVVALEIVVLPETIILFDRAELKDL